MAYLRAVQLIARLTSPLKKGERPSIAPLIEYLQTGGQFTDHLRDWLIRAGSKDRSLPFYLDYRSHRGRRPSAESTAAHVRAYFRITDLVDQRVSRTFCDYVLQLVRGGDRRIVRNGKNVTVNILDDAGVPQFRFTIGGPITQENAIRIAALELNMSESSVKQEYFDTVKAMRDQ
jgi:hypothetical protein